MEEEQHAQNMAGVLGQLGEKMGRTGVMDATVLGGKVYRQQRGLLRQLHRRRDRLSQGGLRQDVDWQNWFLDNWYLTQREGTEGGLAFRRAGLLPAHSGVPQVVYLARGFLTKGLESVDAQGIAAFLQGVQRTGSMTEQELSLFVPALKIALVEQLWLVVVQTDVVDDQSEITPQFQQIFAALATLSTTVMAPILEGASAVETILNGDPAGVYPNMDSTSRRHYRQALCKLAKRSGLTERETAEKVVALAKDDGEHRHLGRYIFTKPLGDKEKTFAPAMYIGTTVVTTLALTVVAAMALPHWWLGLLMLLPLWSVVKECVDFVALRLVPPRPVHRLALSQGIPQEGRTLCVVVALLTDHTSGDGYAKLLERYYLANVDSGDQLQFAILADLPDSPHQIGRESERRVRRAEEAIATLNQRYGSRFYLLFRLPQFQPREERHQGWERKRGALVELVRLLRGRRSGLSIRSGNPQGLDNITYVITLDSDTALTVGSAKKLVGAMLHPLNCPVIDGKRRVVVSGYGLLQPSMAVDLASASRSYFSRLYAGQGGLDPYGSATGEVYHDLFDRGNFCGKGIFDVSAFYTCLDGRFPENQVLSHDLLEGCYLRAGRIGAVELTDGYPYKVTSYLARMHRWIRGDWQLLPWFFPSVSEENGAPAPNPLDGISRWKLWENLRNSLTPIATLVALVVGLCGGQFQLALGVAVLTMVNQVVLWCVDFLLRGGRGGGQRFHATVVTGVGGLLLQTATHFILLPAVAITSVAAICTALWRQWVTHRKLLDWVTASAMERTTPNTCWHNYRKLWLSAVVGIVVTVASPYPLGSALGILWMLSPFFSWQLSTTPSGHRTLTVQEEGFLLHQGALIWRYFADYIRPEDHWLPPDNWQEEPNPTLARRTSPTNIGLGLVSVLSAVDLEFITRERGIFLLEHTLTTVEQLPKWHGHLYNWYNTATLTPLHPVYVSTVDSGNLCGSLLTVAQGLHQWEEHTLASRATALVRAMSFQPLYDDQRNLFYIGYDVTQKCHTSGCYDLLASEARLASYIAVAQGQVPPRHWPSLGRGLVGQGGYRGMASWTGTMFEYFMPNLFLPVVKNSLIYESLCFCLYAQRHSGAPKSVPWGISESAYYHFDGSMHYQYKAHGVAKLALKRGMEWDLVVAPYASFLALSLAPISALANLRHLRDLGLEGRYGLYEGVDYTAQRVRGGVAYEPVRTFMAHHLGMSLVSINNCLNDNVMQKRFLADPKMAAHQELLAEKIPIAPTVLHRPVDAVPQPPSRRPDTGYVRSGQWKPGQCGKYHLVSNGAYTVLCHSDGTTSAQMGATALTTSNTTFAFHGSGTSPMVAGGQEMDFTFDGGGQWTMARDGVTVTATVAVPPRGNGEVRTLTVTAPADRRLEGELVVYLEPILAKMADYNAHFAFSKLFLESHYTGDGVVFTRRPRSMAEGSPALAVLWGKATARFDTSREVALGRGGVDNLERALQRTPQGTIGAVLDPCLLVRFPVQLSPGERVTVPLSITASDSREEAVRGGLQVLEQGGQSHRLDELIHRYALTKGQVAQAFALVEKIHHHPVKVDQPGLWSLGISGDVPLAAVIAGEDTMYWVAIHQFLRHNGFIFDLVYLLKESGDYHRPMATGIGQAAGALDCEGQLGQKGGIQMTEDWATILHNSVTVPEEGESVDAVPPPRRQPPLAVTPGVPPWHFDHENSFVFDTEHHLPPLAWSQMLANEEFGWMTDESGCGHLWLNNARECQLTPWNNDPLAVGGVEQFQFWLDGQHTSLFATGDGHPCTVTYGLGFARWEKSWHGATITTTAFVDMDSPVRILLVESTVAGELVYRLGDSEVRRAIHRQLTVTTVPHNGQSTLTTLGEMTVERAKKTLNRTTLHWNRQTAYLKIHTPDPQLDSYLNGWALYQVIACRLYGRTSRYQNGGAYGFRDQLQDVCATLYGAPQLARAQILRACAHQFEEGDVQHWWHPPTNKGVRTRITDDLLWLGYVVSVYVNTWDDWEILEEEVPFLQSPPLADGELERYDEPTVSHQVATVYHHARRAIDLVLARGQGSHGLALMGGGDWNDGMNLVGAKGRGESVWLTWFLCQVLEKFAPLCEKMGDREGRDRYRNQAQQYAAAANQAWDGHWFLRGYYDDGTTLGSHRDSHCQIDSIAQSFATLSGKGERHKTKTALLWAVERLFQREEGVVQLFDPPFDGTGPNPGYVAGYVPGIRENGGQYTHAALWLSMACLASDMTQEGYDILHALLPQTHNSAIYQVEPYVLSADVYANPDHIGRGGWSWYTGGAGWYVQATVQYLLGLVVEHGKLYLRPNLPPSWPGYHATWRTAQATIHITVERTGTPSLTLDGAPYSQGIDWHKFTAQHTVHCTI